MKVRELKELLGQFDAESEIAIDVRFPQIDFSVKTYSFTYDYDKDYGDGEGFQLSLDIYEADFDYPAILRRIKDAAALIPEEYCQPK